MTVAESRGGGIFLPLTPDDRRSLVCGAAAAAFQVSNMA